MVDAQLPVRLARFLKTSGYDTIHTRDLPRENATPDNEINAVSIQQSRILVTKDVDLNISLTTELEQFIQSQVASGKYNSNEEVILAGIKLLEERERIYKGRFEELQGEIAIGVEQLDRQERLDGREVIEQLRQKN
ncbi:MAG: type II toxin-antitoxin system ParD family antitoxin [Nostoc sp.]